MPKETAPSQARARGQMLVLAALLLVALVAMLGLTIDGSNLYSERRLVQNAADAATLAGTQKLSEGRDQQIIWNSIAEYTHANGADDFQATFSPDGQAVRQTASSPPSGATGICVVAGKDVQLIFMGMFGVNVVPVSARACAAKSSDNCMGGVAIWADSKSGSGITTSGSGSRANGVVHSNSAILTSGDHWAFNGMVEYVTTWNMSGLGHTFVPAVGNPAKVAAAPMPVSYGLADYAPGGAAAVAAGGNYTYKASTWVVAGNVELHGLYYVKGDVVFSGGGQHGTCTIVAEGSIIMSTSSGRDFTPYCDGLTLFANGSGGINMSGGGSLWRGVYYAPKGTILMSGAGNTAIQGSLMGAAVSTSGGNLSVSYDSKYCPANSKARVYLSE